jgi:phosphoglycolate phosphatase
MSLRGATIAFDLDGTLVDTAPDLIGTLNDMLEADGRATLPLAAARHLVGRGARFLIEHGFAEAGAPFEGAAPESAVEDFVARYLARIARESRPFDGVEAALDDLAGEGAILCVCTNKYTDLSAALLDALGLSPRFAAIVGPDRVSARKPSAAHLIEAVRQAGGDPARALMVGDSETDVGAARAAGAPVAVVSFGYTEVPPAELGADALIERFADLPQVARRLLRRPLRSPRPWARRSSPPNG